AEILGLPRRHRAVNFGSVRYALAVLLLTAGVVKGVAAQRDTTLLRRWVGMHNDRPLHLEFYGDTMLVVGDRYALTYRLTLDSLIAEGDTSFAVRYRMSMGYLLLETADSDVVTLKSQSVLGRPLTGRWIGDAGTDRGGRAELVLTTDRVCRYRELPNGAWM